jgi:hypothetical protein
MTIRAILAAIGVMVVLAGCSSRSSGEPNPGASPTSESSGSKFADLLPPRTRELDLTDVDPCADMLTEQQLRELDYDLGYARPPLPGNSDIHAGPDCTYASNGGAGGSHRNIKTLIGISTDEGALAWITDPAREPDSRPEVVVIDGFHALVLPHPLLPDSCLIVVDTAEGQYIEVSSSPAGGEDDSVEPYCTEAERVAGMAIRTLSAVN